MPTVAGFPYFEVQFNAKGAIVDPREKVALLKQVAQQGTERPTDLLVLSHGWNNNILEARDLYRGLLERLRDRRRGHAIVGLNGRKFAVLGVLWPSKRFGDQRLVAGGAAAIGGAIEAVLREQLDDLMGTFDAEGADNALKRARELVESLDDSTEAQIEFVHTLRACLGVPEMESEAEPEDGSATFLAGSAAELMEILARPVPKPPPAADDGGAAGLGDASTGAAAMFALNGAQAAALQFVNYATYFEMKRRAGIVGMLGLNPLLANVDRERPDLRLHLAGHSFGARLVTAAVLATPDGSALRVETLSLLQAAFSHNAFAHHFDGRRDGFFRSVVTRKRVSGPIIITHTRNDTAVGFWYAIVSRATGVAASFAGGPTDKYGGLGANGAQHTPEAVASKLVPNGQPYTFANGSLYNLLADNVIQHHSDIERDEVANAMLQAIAAT